LLTGAFDVVLDQVVAVAAVHDALRNGDEGADHELVVAGLALEAELGAVRVDV